jgi:hypothetical protein
MIGGGSGPAHREQLGSRGLDVSGFVNSAAQDDRFAAVQTPEMAEAGMGFGKHQFLQPGRCPCLAAVRADVDAPDSSVAAPGDSANLGLSVLPMCLACGFGNLPAGSGDDSTIASRLSDDKKSTSADQ